MSIKRRSFIGTFTAVALLASSTTHAADGAAKRIMVDGDSNSWGFILVESGSTTRHPADVRWPGVLKVALGQNYDVIEEGLCARTTDIPDPTLPHISGTGLDGAELLDGGTLTTTDGIDGVHLSPEGHKTISVGVAERVKAILQ